jgi:hypothetical protein
VQPRTATSYLFLFFKRPAILSKNEHWPKNCPQKICDFSVGTLRFIQRLARESLPAGSPKNDEAPAFVPQSRDYGTAGEGRSPKEARILK